METLRSHWKLVLAGSVASVLVALLVAGRLPPSYSASGSVVIVDATTRVVDGEEKDVNPFSVFSPSLQTTAVVLAQVLDSQPTRESLADSGLVGSYEVIEPGDPIISFSVTADDPDVAENTIDTLVGRVDSELQERQEAVGVPQDQWISSETITTSSATADSAVPLRVGAAILVLGVAASVSLAFLADPLAARRRRRASEREAESSREQPTSSADGNAGRRVGRPRRADGTDGADSSDTRGQTKLSPVPSQRSKDKSVGQSRGKARGKDRPARET